MPLLPSRARFGAASVNSGDELRENVYRLLERSARRAEQARRGGGLEVYRSSARLLRAACGERWVQETVFPRETRLTRQFFEATGLGGRDPEPLIRDSLLGNVWTRAWTETLLELDAGAFGRVCRARGAERLAEAHGAGRGLVLAHSHTLFSQIFWRWLEHEGLPPGVTLRQWTWGRKGSEVADPKTAAIEGARELHAALTALRRGGMVHVLADGHQGGAQYRTVPFFARQRPFRRTFAELAVSAGVPALPVGLVWQPDGRIALEIGEPLEAGDGPQAQKIEALGASYIRHLGQRWEQMPADIPWTQMRLHLKYPPLDPIVGGGKGD